MEDQEKAVQTSGNITAMLKQFKDDHYLDVFIVIVIRSYRENSLKKRL